MTCTQLYISLKTILLPCFFVHFGHKDCLCLMKKKDGKSKIVAIKKIVGGKYSSTKVWLGDENVYGLNICTDENL